MPSKSLYRRLTVVAPLLVFVGATGSASQALAATINYTGSGKAVEVVGSPTVKLRNPTAFRIVASPSDTVNLTGKFASSDPRYSAIHVQSTSANVVVSRATVTGRSANPVGSYYGGQALVTAEWQTNLTVKDSTLTASNPNVIPTYSPSGEMTSAAANGRAIYVDSSDSLIVENNVFTNTGGINFNNGRYETGNGNGVISGSIRIVNNRATNIAGSISNGKGGYLPSNIDRAGKERNLYSSFAKIWKVKGAQSIEIGWNEITNNAYSSNPEDNINIFDTVGSADRPIRVHDNYVYGGWSPNPDDTTQVFNGGGIITDGSNAGTVAERNANGPQFVQITGNSVVNTSNYGIALAVGHDNFVDNNRILGTNEYKSKLGGNRVQWATGGGGLVVQDGLMWIAPHVGEPAAYFNNLARNNTVMWYAYSHWMRTGANLPDPSGVPNWTSANSYRNDTTINDCQDAAYSNVSCSGTTHRYPSGSTETAASIAAAELTYWRGKAAAAAQKIGPR